MGFTRILFSSLLLAVILLISSQVTARDLAETTKTMETSLFSGPRIPTYPIVRDPPIYRKPPRVPITGCCPDICRGGCGCCSSAGEAMNADDP